MIIILLTALLSTLSRKKILLLYIAELQSKGIQSLILTGFILVICHLIYKTTDYIVY